MTALRTIAATCMTLLSVSFMLSAQTTEEEMLSCPEKTGGVYFAYPTAIPLQTETPKGYEPFYISHYGRHGSRYLISDNDYKWVLDLFGEAHGCNALTDLGEDTYIRLQEVWKEAEGHGEDLTPLGVRQHRGIAERMYRSFPEVFRDSAEISARSTIVLRCAMSMAAFGDRLKELNPKLKISYEASRKYMYYMNYHSEESNMFTSSTDGPVAEEYRKFEEAHTNPDRLVASLFNDDCFVLRKVNPRELMWGLYWIASDMQNMETEISFYDLFEPEELFDLWQCFNFHFYIGNANHPDGNGLVTDNAKALLRNIVECADEAVAGRTSGATLRFGHDGNIIPLLALMRIENYNVEERNPYNLYKVWCDYKASPMAANLQIVFFTKKKGGTGDILVKFLHNEAEMHIPVNTDMFPYYRWEDVRAYYMNILED